MIVQRQNNHSLVICSPKKYVGIKYYNYELNNSEILPSWMQSAGLRKKMKTIVTMDILENERKLTKPSG